MNHRIDALDKKLPLLSVMLVYTIWGVQPLYWQLFHQLIIWKMLQ